MTAFSARIQGRIPKGRNKKDGATGRGRRKDNSAEFEALGFIEIDWNKWSYTWEGDFPVFRLVPGTVDFMPGWVAIYNERQIPIGQAQPEAIKARLDEEILAITRHDAEIIEAELDWDEMEAEGLAIDVDDFMAKGQWVRS